MGTMGAVGAAFALSATTLPVTAVGLPAMTAPAGAHAGVSPNVSVPGRMLTTVGDGTWQVGVDVAAGTYRTAGGATCSRALRTARTGGTVTARSTAPGQTTVVLTADAGWFTTSGCAPWKRVG
jgi:hypothetical protein